MSLFRNYTYIITVLSTVRRELKKFTYSGTSGSAQDGDVLTTGAVYETGLYSGNDTCQSILSAGMYGLYMKDLTHIKTFLY